MRSQSRRRGADRGVRRIASAASGRRACARHATEGLGPDDLGALRQWLFGGLQFALAADIVRSAISPTWEQIGQLAAIAAIRTFLSYFLERDLMELRRQGAEAERAA